MTDREEKIRKAAYEIWKREGSPEGREQEHWDVATLEVDRGGRRVDSPTTGDQPTTDEAASDTKRARRP